MASHGEPKPSVSYDRALLIRQRIGIARVGPAVDTLTYKLVETFPTEAIRNHRKRRRFSDVHSLSYHTIVRALLTGAEV